MRLAAPILTAGMLALSAVPLTAQRQSTTVLVHVLSAESRGPLADAEVIVDDGDVVGVTNANGVFQTRDLAAGEHRIRARYLGFRTGSAVVRVDVGGTAETTIVLRVEPIALDSLQVVTYRSTLAYDMRAFNARKHRGNGYFFTRADIDRVKPHTFSDLLRMVPGMRFDCGSFLDDCTAGMQSAPPSGVLTVRQGNIVGPMHAEGCPIQYYVDGHYEPHPNINDLNPRDIQAVEVYVHGEQAPARYSLRKNARCGVVLVWMRISLRY